MARTAASVETVTREIEEYSIPEPNTGCWLWTRSQLKKGYGQFKRLGERLAHRVSYVAHHGAVPAGLVVMHSCNQPACVNPDHISAGTYSENNKYTHASGRHVSQVSPEKLARGDRNGSRLHPESLTRGDEHWMRKYPDRVGRGENSLARKYRDRLPRGDDHWTRSDPDRMHRGSDHWTARTPERLCYGDAHWTRHSPEKMNPPSGADHYKAVADAVQVEHCKALRASGMSYGKISRLTGFQGPTIRTWCVGRARKNG